MKLKPITILAIIIFALILTMTVIAGSVESNETDYRSGLAVIVLLAILFAAFLTGKRIISKPIYILGEEYRPYFTYFEFSDLNPRIVDDAVRDGSVRMHIGKYNMRYLCDADMDRMLEGMVVE